MTDIRDKCVMSARCLLGVMFLALAASSASAQEPSGGFEAQGPLGPAPAVPLGEPALSVPAGSFYVGSGPYWGGNIPTYTCLETCSMLFGGAPDDYECSTQPDSVNNLAWASSWGSGLHCADLGGVPIAEDFKQGTSTNCGSLFCYISTYVSDWCDLVGQLEASENFCFQEALEKEITSGNDVDGDGEIDLVVEVGILTPSEYDFTLTWRGDEEVAILDTVPAEWDVTTFLMENFGFETGDFTGWVLNIPAGGTAGVVTDYTGYNGTLYGPQEGDFFALLKTNGPGSETSATQVFSATLGTTLSGWAAFDAQDYCPFDDAARVDILDSDGFVIATPYFRSVCGVGDYADDPWATWSWTAPAAGDYAVRYSVVNDLDGILDSRAMFDATPTLDCMVAPANKKGGSATKITCMPVVEPGSQVFYAMARCHDNKNNKKCRPTSCGALYLNDGAAAYLLDEDGELISPPIAESNKLCLAAVEDLNGDGLVYNGTGDEDGDGLSDYFEACEGPTYVCDPDSDDDGVLDGADECPLEGPPNPELGEILDRNGCIRQSQCSDGVDNNFDGLIDLADPSCDDILDDLEGCIPDTCGSFSACDVGPGGAECFCFATDPGATIGACVDNYFCSGAADCSADPGICAADGRICLYQTCCGFATCGPASCTGVIQSPDMTLLPGGPTATGF